MHEDEMIIQVLGCDSNMNVYVIDEINWSLNGEFKQYCKTL